MLLQKNKLLICILIFLALALGILLIILMIPRKEVILKGQVKNEFASSSDGNDFQNTIVQDDFIAATSASATESFLQPATDTQTIVVFGGDVMLSRTVGQEMERSKDWSWPFAKISSIFSDADIAVANLESPFKIGGSHFVPTGSFSFNADPNSSVGLKSAGFDLLSLANNHILNQGRQGIEDTLEILKENDIASAGAGLNEAGAHQGSIIEAQGIRFGFLAYGYPNDFSVAKNERAGIADMELAKMRRDIGNMESSTDIIVILMHAGAEYVSSPNKQQKEFAHAAIDAGADLVIGHHPHWVQTTEVYRGKPILYSLGNLVFDQMWSRATQQGAIAKVFFSGKELRQVEIIPIHIYNYGQPDIAPAKEAQEILDRMGLDGAVINI